MELRKNTYNKKRFLRCEISRIFSKILLKKGQYAKARHFWNMCLVNLKNSPKLYKKSVLKNALKYAPKVDLRRLRLGRKYIDVPFPIRKRRKFFVLFKWLLAEDIARFPLFKLSEVFKNLELVEKKQKNWHEKAKRNTRFLRYRW